MSSFLFSANSQGLSQRTKIRKKRKKKIRFCSDFANLNSLIRLFFNIFDWIFQSGNSKINYERGPGNCSKNFKECWFIFHNISIFLAYRLGFINLYSEIEKAYNEVAFELMKKYDFHLSPFSRKFEIINAYCHVLWE